ncbi:hypothetical protein ISCGN_002377 [Ixodes scapularis]
MVSTGTQTSSDDLRVPSVSPSTSGVVRQTPPPSTRKDVGVPTPSKEQGLATLAPCTALPPKGRGMAPRPSGTQTIPGLPTKPATSKGQPLATTTDEPMDQSGLKSDEGRSMSGSECSLPGTGGSTRGTCESRCLESGVSTDPEPRRGACTLGARCLVVHRGSVRPIVSTRTQTSTDNLRLPSRSLASSGAVPVTPLSNRKVDAASSASTSGQGLTSPAPPGPLAPKGRGLPPRTSAPQRKPGESPKQTTSKGQLPAATDEPMDDTRLREAGVEAVYCLARGAPKGPNIPRAQLNHQGPLFPGHGYATHSQTWVGEPTWLGVRSDATHQAPTKVGAPCVRVWWPTWLGSVVTLLTKHLAPKVQAPPAGLGVRGDATLQTPAFTGAPCGV